MKKKQPTVSELLAVVNAYNKAHELHLHYPPEIRAAKNPLLENLYEAAAIASQELKAVLSANLNIDPPKV